ncbi:MAG: phage tail length tape measure family protein [Clostridia bacterium]
MGQIGSMWYNIGAKTADLEKGLANSKSGLSKMNDSFKSAIGISLTAAAAWAAAGKALQFVINEAMEAEKADTKLNQVLDSTRGISGMTKESLDSVASSLSKVTVNSEETIKEAEALMLTFTKVGKEIFPDAIEAAMNMSAAFGQDLQSSVIQLGKTLNDPSGMAAMKRIGVSFSEAQISMAKELFETGQVAEYQKLILSELNTEVGGMAKAMGTTHAGQIAIFKNNVGELGEAVGKKLIPPLSEAISALNKIMTVGEYFRTEVIKTSQRVHDEGKSFEYYRDSILKVAVATGRLRAEDAALIKGVGDGSIVVEEARQRARLISEDIGLLTKYQWLALDATEQSTSSLMGWGSGLLSASAAVKELSGATEESILTVEEMNKAITSLNEEKINQIETWTDIEQDYSDKLEELHDKSFDLFLKLQDLKSRGYSEESKKVQEVRGQLGEINQTIQEEMDAYQLKTNTVILGYMQEKLAADGILDDKETEWLIQKGIEWGIYADTALTAYREASAAADEFLKHRENAEKDNTVYIDYVVRGGGGKSSLVIPKPGTAKEEEMASGGSFTVPNWAGYEGFDMGGVATASAGEKITVSRQDTNRELLNAINQLNVNMGRLPTQMRDAILLA